MLVIAGKNNIAVAAINILINELHIPKCRIAVVCNATDDCIDRWQLSLRKYASKEGIKILSLAEAQARADIFISLEYDKIIKPEDFKTDRLYNIHFSLLPRYKGMYTSIWPILNGDSISGCTLHLIDSGIDTGEIIDQIEFSIKDSNTSYDLYLNYIKSSIKLFKNNICAILEGAIVSYPQKSEESTYNGVKSIIFDNLDLNIIDTAWSIERKIKAFAFRPYQLPKFNGTPVVNSEITDISSRERPGEILEETEDYLCVSTIDYDIRLYKDRRDVVFNAILNNDEKTLIDNLKNVTSIEDRSDESWSLLMVAAYYARDSIAEVLIGQGADVNAYNYKGTSVLMYAKDGYLKTSNRKVYDMLLESGADLEHRDFNFKCLRDYVSKSKFNELRLEG